MKSRFATFIISVIIILIILILGIFGIAIWQEVTGEEVSPQNIITQISSEDTSENQVVTPNVVENTLDNIMAENRTDTNVDTTTIQIDKYLYNQLDNESKIIYQAFEKNKENMKSGTYQVEFGNQFSSVLSQTNGQDKLADYYQSAIEAYTYDNPDVFYLSPNKMYLNIESTTRGNNVTYNVFMNQGSSNSNYLIDEFSSKAEVDRALNEIENIKNNILANRTGNTYQDIRLVHDYLVDNIEYDSSISLQNIYNIYGALVNGKAVCEGYARSFKYLMDELGIPCVLVIGTGTNSEGQTEDHAWNYVEVNGSWYAIDTTWDDPILRGGGTLPSSAKYRYFLKGSTEFYQDHTPRGNFTEGGKIFNYPTLSTSGI